MAREYMQLSTFMASEFDFHGLRALLCNRDWIYAQYVCGWNPQPPVLLYNNTATHPCLRRTDGMAVGNNSLHLTYLQHTYFLCARRLLLYDLDESSDGDPGSFWRTDLDGLLRIDPDNVPESLNVRPESP